jgi:hypothetical protein
MIFPTEQQIETRPAQDIPSVPSDQAVSLTVPFDTIKRMFGGISPLKRPNRSSPIHAGANIAVSRDKLAEIAARFTPPQSWFEEEDVF